MLTLIRSALDELEEASQGDDGAAQGDARAEPPIQGQSEQATEQVTEQVGRLLVIFAGDVCSTNALMEWLGLSHRRTLLYDYLRPALAAGWIEMTDPAHPRGSRQRYRLTSAGQGLLDAGVGEQYG